MQRCQAATQSRPIDQIGQSLRRDGIQCKDNVLQWLHKQDICDASCKLTISSSASGGGRSLQASADIANEVELLAIPESYWFSEPAQVLCIHGYSLWACTQAGSSAWVCLQVHMQLTSSKASRQKAPLA